ncbi:MAG: hypothetical protein EOM50_14215 [Erysipelotrichia bacterium]|nr:hypothetical protein [Erysipelotrichia bacterium]
MPKDQMKPSLQKKKKKQQPPFNKESINSLNVMETLEKTIKQQTSKGKKSALDERTLTPKAKALLEELSSELGVSKEVIAELAITLYRFYKDKV